MHIILLRMQMIKEAISSFFLLYCHCQSGSTHYFSVSRETKTKNNRGYRFLIQHPLYNDHPAL